MLNHEGLELKEGESVTGINLGLKMIQRNGGFVFGTDALLLAAFMKPLTHKRAVDFGCGSGAVSLLCAALGKFAHIDAIEVKPNMRNCVKGTYVLMVLAMLFRLEMRTLGILFRDMKNSA